MKSAKLILLGIFLTSSILSFGQVGVDNIDPDPSSVLDLNSTDKGLLIPRMTSSQRQAIGSPANSLLVFDTTLNVYFYFFNGTWHTLNPWIPSASTSDIYYNTGNVGIGNDAPAEKLHIGQTGGFLNLRVGRWASLGETGNSIATVLGNNARASITTNSAMEFITTTVDGAKAIKMQYNEGISFHTFQGSVTAGQTFSGSERMRIDNNGNVGIGTTSPTEKLHINGAIRGNAAGQSLRINSDFGYVDIGPMNATTSHFQTDRSNFYFNKPIYVDGSINSYTTNLSLSTNGTERINVQGSNGNVGIGTSSPGYKLDVNGSVNASALLINGTPVTAGATVPEKVIVMWSGALANIPSGWVLCDGSTYTINTPNDFTVPDLRERFIVGAGTGDNISVSGSTAYAPGVNGGVNTVTLTAAQIPAHSHTFTIRSSWGNDGGVAYAQGEDGGTTATVSTNNNTGGGGAHENRPPYYALAFIMKLNHQ